MLKNVPLLSFDQDQNTWCLDFISSGNNPVKNPRKRPSRPDKLARFLQDYWNSVKSSSAITFDQNPCMTFADRQKTIKQLKLAIRQKEKVIKKNKIQPDNLLSFLRDHTDTSTTRKKYANKTRPNILVTLTE